MSVKDRVIDLVIRYGFQVLGALVILAAGLLLARWFGNMTQRRLERQKMEPPIRELLVRVVRIIVLLFTLVLVLDKFGVQVAPLVAGIGVAGVGIGLAAEPASVRPPSGLSPRRATVRRLDMVGDRGSPSRRYGSFRGVFAGWEVGAGEREQ